MPEYQEIPEEDMSKFEANVERFEKFLAELPNDVTLYDLDNFEVILYCRLRSILTQDQLHQRAHMLITKAEHLLHTPGVFTDEVGGEVTPILVENFEDAQDLQNALHQLTAGLSEDDLTALLDQGEEE